MNGANGDRSRPQDSELKTPRPVVVRRATPADAPAIADIVARSFPDKFLPAFATEERAIRALTPYIHASITRAGNYVFVATIGDQIAGTVSLCVRKAIVIGVFGMFVRAVGLPGALRAMLVLGMLGDPSPTPDEAYVEVLGVAPEFQRHGVGRAMMVAVEAFARELRKRRLTLYVTANNHAAQALYTGQGMTVQRRTPSLVGLVLFRAPGFWRMEKRLV